MIAALIPLAALLGARLAPSTAAPGWEALPLPSLCRSSAPAPHAVPLADGSHLAETLRLAAGAPALAEGPALAVPLLVQMLEREARRGSLAVEIYRGAPPLIARGDPAAIAALRQRLVELEDAARALEIEVRVGFEPGARGADAPETDGARLYAARLRSGERAVFGERHSRAYLAGWDVEVAADSGISAPVVGSALTGETLHLVARRIEGGAAVHVEGLLDLAELAGIDDFDPESVDLGVVQQPLVRSVQVVFAGRVERGARLAVELRGAPLARPDWTVWIEAESAADAREPAGWALLDLAFVASQAAELPPARPGAGIDEWVPIAAGTSPFEPLPPSAVAAAVEAARGAGARTPREPLHWTNTLLFVPAGEAETLAEARALVGAAEAARLATRAVEVGWKDLSVTLPVTTGRPARVRAGLERAWLVDYSVEIAPETWMPQPHTAAAFDGLNLDLAPEADALGCTVWIAHSAEPAEISEQRARLGRMQLPERTFRGAAARVRAGEPRVRLCGEAPDGVTLALR